MNAQVYEPRGEPFTLSFAVPQEFRLGGRVSVTLLCDGSRTITKTLNFPESNRLLIPVEGANTISVLEVSWIATEPPYEYEPVRYAELSDKIEALKQLYASTPREPEEIVTTRTIKPRG